MEVKTLGLEIQKKKRILHWEQRLQAMKQFSSFYPFVVNPMAYRELVNLGVKIKSIPKKDIRVEEDYQNFKRNILIA